MERIRVSRELVLRALDFSKKKPEKNKNKTLVPSYRLPTFEYDSEKAQEVGRSVLAEMRYL